MDIMLMLCLGLLASIGIVQIVDWAVRARKHREIFHSYQLVTLYDQPDRLEQRIREALGRHKWSLGPDCILLFVDMGLSEESQQIYDKMTAGEYGVLICTYAELPVALRRFDDILAEGVVRNRKAV